MEKSKRAALPPAVSPGKRVFDFVLGSAILLAASPIFLLTAVFIKLVSKGPVFFKQERIGYRGKPFTLWKFRTMNQNATTKNHEAYVQTLLKSDAPMTKLDTHDKRIIPFGNILRQTGIDELPQLINVLKGEMSLVGPRPCLACEAEAFTSLERKRFNTLPGLTGLWQVSGKNKLTFGEMIAMDIEYAQNASVVLDLAIMFRTIPAIFGLVADHLKTAKAN